MADSKLYRLQQILGPFALDSITGNSMREIIDHFGVTHSREPGVIVRRAVVPEDGISSVFEIEFWKQFKTYAIVSIEN